LLVALDERAFAAARRRSEGETPQARLDGEQQQCKPRRIETDEGRQR